MYNLQMSFSVLEYFKYSFTTLNQFCHSVHIIYLQFLHILNVTRLN